jgi:hypothetical protein
MQNTLINTNAACITGSNSITVQQHLRARPAAKMMGHWSKRVFVRSRSLISLDLAA